MKKTKTPKPKKAKALSLRRLCCHDLVEWVETVDRNVPQPVKNQRLLTRYSKPYYLRLLKLCGTLPAQYHFQWCQTAAQLESVPTIEMKVAGGKPDVTKMPPFTASLKRIAAINGIVIHRWHRGAFILHHPLKEALRAGD